MPSNTCPKCYLGTLQAIGERRSPFSGGKAVAGTIIAGPLAGLVAGSLGKKKTTYRCDRCGYTIEK